MVQATRERNGNPKIGIGGALRKARERRGLAIEDAARGTRLRSQYLEALEREAFSEVPGEVYVRGFLRSYAGFLGLDADKVVAHYGAATGGGTPEPSPVDRAPALAAARNRDLPGSRRHFPWPLAAALAAILLVAAAAVGLLSGSDSSPAPVETEGVSQAPVGPQGVQIDFVATRSVEVRVVADGVTVMDERLDEGDARSFEADEGIDLWLEYGRSIRLTVNGEQMGKPGTLTEPWQETFTPEDERGERSTESG